MQRVNDQCRNLHLVSNRRHPFCIFGNFGKGLPFLENRKNSHYGVFSPAMRQRALASLAPSVGEERCVGGERCASGERRVGGERSR